MAENLQYIPNLKTSLRVLGLLNTLAYFMLSDTVPSLMNIEITADLIVHTISYNLSYVHFISIVQSQNLKYSLTCIHQPSLLLLFSMKSQCEIKNCLHYLVFPKASSHTDKDGERIMERVI